MTYVAPGIIGVFWGAPLIARELETGTHRLVWNQSITRTRWLAFKLGLVGGAAMVVAGLLSLAVSWWADPIDTIVGTGAGSGFPTRVSPLLFAGRGIAPIGYTAFAFLLGVTLGLLIRRSVPAMALTLAVFVAVQVAVPFWVRPHLITPIQHAVTINEQSLGSFSTKSGDRIAVTVKGPRTAWIISNSTIGANGQKVDSLPSWMGKADCVPTPGDHGQPSFTPTVQVCFSRLADLGYRQQVIYQPGSRFWALQRLETGLFLGLSLLLAGFCFWWTRARLS